MTQIKLKVLHPRKYQNAQGQEGTHWTQVGRGFMNDRGIDLDLWYVPTTPNQDGRVRLILREDDGRPAQPQGSYQGQQGQGGGSFARQPQGGQERPQAPQGGGLRPQHRDALGGAQGAVYGGAAGQQSFEGREVGAGVDDDIPFAPVDSRVL